MEDKLITYNTALLAKDNGFNIPTKAWYYDNTLVEYGKNGIREMYENNTIPNCISAPTQSLLQKWLREIHNLWVELHITKTDTPNTFKEGYGKKYLVAYRIHKLKVDGHFYGNLMVDGFGDSWEEALELALEKALNKIET